MNELTPIALANGSVTQASKLRVYFDRVFQAEESGEEFPVQLAHIWPIGYSRKDNAVAALRKNFVQGTDYVSVHSIVEREIGATSKTEYKLSKEAAIRFCELKATPLRQYSNLKQGTYFVACKEASAVKIGLAVDLKRRLFTLQAGNPFVLQILLFLPFNTERKLHKRFSHLAIGREWFTLSDEI